MKITAILFLVVASGFAAWRSQSTPETSAPDLRAIYDAHDWFKLRDAIAGKEALPLYRGAVAAAFDQQSEAEEALHPLINGPTSSKDADEANDWLSYLFVRRGEYQKAAGEMDEGAPLRETLKSLPDQSVSRSEESSIAVHLSHRRLFVPLVVQGKQAEFFLDSDANFSFMSESQARALGLKLHDSALTVHGAGGIGTGFRTAVADELSVGNVYLKNVAFMVMPDNEDVFSGLQPQEQGALGLPVLLAFRTFRYSKGKLDIALPSGAGEASSQNMPKQNLCFDGLDPVVQVTFSNQPVPTVLDTGAAITEIWPPFAKHFSAFVNSAGKASSAVENSFGGKSRVPLRILPELALGLSGCDIHIRPARLFLAATTPNSQRYYGRLGLDALTSMRELTIDFAALQISVH